MEANEIGKYWTFAVRQTVQARAPLTTGGFELGIELMEVVDFGMESNISRSLQSIERSSKQETVPFTGSHVHRHSFSSTSMGRIIIKGGMSFCFSLAFIDILPLSV